MNESLGNSGRTVTYIASVEAEPINQSESLRALNDDLKNGSVAALLILGGNPAFSAPVDFDFAQYLAKAAFRAHLERGRKRDFRALPVAHPAESLPGIMESDAGYGLRRHGIHRSAAHHSALRRQIRARSSGRFFPDVRTVGLRHCPRSLAEEKCLGRLRKRLAAGAS